MAMIGRTTDRWGRTVELTDARWQHIVDRHADLVSRQAGILATVARPDFVNRDADHANRENFYRVLSGQDIDWPFYLKVCVEYGPSSGAIITAYATHQIKRTEQTIWP